jgi:hypothetical protein
MQWLFTKLELTGSAGWGTSTRMSWCTQQAARAILSTRCLRRCHQGYDASAWFGGCFLRVLAVCHLESTFRLGMPLWTLPPSECRYACVWISGQYFVLQAGIVDMRVCCSSCGSQSSRVQSNIVPHMHCLPISSDHSRSGSSALLFQSTCIWLPSTCCQFGVTA